MICFVHWYTFYIDTVCVLHWYHSYIVNFSCIGMILVDCSDDHIDMIQLLIWLLHWHNQSIDLIILYIILVWFLYWYDSSIDMTLMLIGFDHWYVCITLYNHWWLKCITLDKWHFCGGSLSADVAFSDLFRFEANCTYVCFYQLKRILFLFCVRIESILAWSSITIPLKWIFQFCSQ